MNKFIPWDSQSYEKWAGTYANGKFIELNGIRTHYVEKGEGNPIVFVHGFLYDHLTWNHNIDFLAQYFKVYALDLWGFGYSVRAKLDYDYPLFSEQLLLFIDEMNIEKAILMGHSMGGGSCVYFSSLHPERVDKLILVDATGMPNPLPFLGKLSNLPVLGELMFNFPTNHVRKLALRTNWFYNSEYITDEYFQVVTRFHKIKGTSRIMLTILRKQFLDKIEEKVKLLGTHHLPILIIWGQEDTAVPLKCGMQMQRLLSGSRLEIIETAGHCPHDETAAEFNRLVIDFLFQK